MVVLIGVIKPRICRTLNRVKAAAWIQKLRSLTEDLNLRNDYLKLFLFALQRKRLVGPFSDVPPDTLEAFPEGYGLTEMMKCLIEFDAKEDRSGTHPPCTTEISPDLKEYAAVQKIPNHGVHCYLAISNEPLPKWERADQVALPPGVMRPKDSTPDLSTLKSGVSWVDSLRKSPCKKSKSEAPCGTCKPPAPCKPISSTTSFLKPCPGAGKKSARKKQFTDDGLSGLGRDREDLEMADALLCSPSLRKGEKAVKVDDEDVGNDDAGEEDEDADESEREEEREEVGEVPSDSGDEEGSEIYYTAPGSAGPDLIGGYPVYKSSGMDLNLTPMPSGMLDEPAPHRPVFRRARQAFIGKLPESFEELYNTPLDAPLSSWNYPEAPDYRGDDQPIPTMELLQRVWEDQDYYRRFPYNLSFVPDRPLEFHVQHAFGHPDPAYFNRFRLMPPRLADVPKEERPPTIKFFEVFRELSPSEYEEMLQQEEEDDTGDEYPYPYPYP